ncbi:MAG: serine hydrolase domain-containing protein [Caulobacteraceae bacterium]
MRDTTSRRLLSLALAGVLALSNLVTSAVAQPVPAPAAPAAPILQPAAPAPQPAPRVRRAPARTPAAPVAAAPAIPAPVLTAMRPGARLAPGTPIPAAELEAFIDGYVTRAMAADHIAGVTVSVVQNGVIVFKKGYGYASLAPLRPVNPDTTLFRIGSISKTFTWMAVLQQIEAGRMRLDGPVNLYLPESLRVPDQGMTRPILVRDLMNHMPGFEDRVLGHIFERDFDRERPLALYLQQERPNRVREAGTIPSYSNYGAALAGEAASYVSGKPYEALVESSILVPAGMFRTTFREVHPPKSGIPAPMNATLASDLAALPLGGHGVRGQVL